MSHVVLSKGASGEQNIDEAGSLEQALEKVERLRNDGDVTDVRILREVPIEVKTYYRVVALDEAATDAAPASDGSDAPTPSPPATPLTVAPLGEPPSGSAVLSPPPAAAQPPAEEEALTGDRRSSLFGRG